MNKCEKLNALVQSGQLKKDDVFDEIRKWFNEGGLDEDLKWIKDMIINKEIKYDFTHSTLLSEHVENNNVEKIYSRFKALFSMEFNFCDFEKLKAGEIFIIGGTENCYDCDEIVHFMFDGKTLSNVSIEYKDMEREIGDTSCNKIGSEEYSFDIEFPTGQLIIGDWIPFSNEVLKPHIKKEHSLSSSLGSYERALDLANLNVLHMYVGNSSPSIFYKDGLAVIANCDYDDNDEEIIPIPNGEYIGNICTDLWWATIVDATIYKKLLIDTFGEEKGLSNFDTIQSCNKSIKPGVYKCTYLNIHSGDDSSALYIKMQWIRN